MAPNQLPPGPVWAVMRIERKEDLGKVPQVFQPPGTAGKDGDKMTCIFCGCVRSAVVTRARLHVAGVTGLTIGITVCPGPKQTTEEDDSMFAARHAQFVAARAACVAQVEAARAAEALAKESVALDKLTAPASTVVVPGGATARPHKQLKLDADAAAGLRATEALARGFYAAGLAANVLENPFIQQGLRAVRQAARRANPFSRRKRAVD